MRCGISPLQSAPTEGIVFPPVPCVVPLVLLCCCLVFGVLVLCGFISSVSYLSRYPQSAAWHLDE